jgi:hypothetical protein
MDPIEKTYQQAPLGHLTHPDERAVAVRIARQRDRDGVEAARRLLDAAGARLPDPS